MYGRYVISFASYSSVNDVANVSVVNTDVKVAISISVVVTFLLTVILGGSLLLLGYCVLQARHATSSKEKYVTMQFKGKIKGKARFGDPSIL